jgi:nickel-type superoxide dismutase maturation protease
VGHGQATRYSACAAKRSVPPGGGRAAGAPAPLTAARRGGANPGASVIAGVALASACASWWAWSAWWAWRHLDRVEVFGSSMAPALQPGDHVLVWRTRSVQPGDIVAAPDPREPSRTVLKRVADIGPEGVSLLGDNADQSTDSRLWGPVPIASVQGKAIYRYAPPARAGRLSNAGSRLYK